MSPYVCETCGKPTYPSGTHERTKDFIDCPAPIGVAKRVP